MLHCWITDLTSQSSERLLKKYVRPIQVLAEKKCSHSEGEDENVLIEPWISRRHSSFRSLCLIHPRPFLFNRLLEELNCAQLMHNKQMELNAITSEWHLYLFLSASLSRKVWNKSKLWFLALVYVFCQCCYAGGETLQNSTVIMWLQITDLSD